MHRFFTITVLAATICSAPLAAQSLAPDSTMRVVQPAAAPLAIDLTQRWVPAAANAPITVSSAPAVLTPMFVPRQPSRRSTAMMLVGGAGMLVGAAVNGDAGTILMIGGGVIGLFGLWEHLK